MATVPSVRDWSAMAGSVVTAAMMQEISDALTFLLGPPVCQVRQTVGQSTSTGVWTELTMDAEDADTGGWHSTVSNTARVIPQIAGRIRLAGSVAWTANASGNRRGGRWQVNGSEVNGSQAVIPPGGGSMGIVVPTIDVICNGSTDYITIAGMQDAGTLATAASASLQSHITAWYVGTV